MVQTTFTDSQLEILKSYVERYGLANKKTREKLYRRAVVDMLKLPGALDPKKNEDKPAVVLLKGVSA